MVCKIGGGAYGQVWMALSVTGAHRAIKIIAREDFRLEKTFEREFEGIKHFEPISRSHAGLVDILHVGRSFEEHCYYYVMELADDCAGSGSAIDPYHYEPRTLRTDIVAEKPIDVHHCIEVGITLAEALFHLHRRGLSHRDVKPSNVIFVDGEAKLADIGLVAETGQQAFVGTEGFVPPEGPGTPAADIYSLGMVLYELSTGKDRLDFPELPDELSLSSQDRQYWQALNQVICKCCAPEAGDRYTSARQLAHALREILAPTQKAWSHPGRWKAPWVVGGAMAAMGLLLLTRGPREDTGDNAAPMGLAQTSPADASPSDEAVAPVSSPVPVEEGPQLLIQSSPERAYVYGPDGREIGELPFSTTRLAHVPYQHVEIAAPGFQPKSVPVARMIDLNTPQRTHALTRSPQAKRGWTSPLGVVFRYDVSKSRHLSKWPVGEKLFTQFQAEGLLEPVAKEAVARVRADTVFPENDSPESHFILTTPEIAQAFCEWIMAEDHRKGPLREGQAYRPVLAPVFAGRSYQSTLQLLYCEIPLSVDA